VVIAGPEDNRRGIKIAPKSISLHRRFQRDEFVFDNQAGKERTPVTTYANSKAAAEPRPSSLGIGSFLFAVGLTIILYLLVSAMVRHGFFGNTRGKVSAMIPAVVSVGPEWAFHR
jgi:hypothetical protein